MKTHAILAARLLSGSLLLILLWLAAYEFEEKNHILTVFLSALAGIVLFSAVSLLGIAIGLRQQTRPAASALPLLIPIVISSLAISDSIFRPFLFWSLIGVIALTIALIADVLTHRLFRRETNS